MDVKRKKCTNIFQLKALCGYSNKSVLSTEACDHALNFLRLNAMRLGISLSKNVLSISIIYSLKVVIVIKTSNLKLTGTRISNNVRKFWCFEFPKEVIHHQYSFLPGNSEILHGSKIE